MAEADADAVDLDFNELLAEYTLLRLDVVCLKTALDLAKSEIKMLRSSVTLDVTSATKKKHKQMSQNAKDKLRFYHSTKDTVQQELGLTHPAAWQSIKKMTDVLYESQNSI